MAASRIIEEDSGTYAAGRRNEHNGYYGGDFSGEPFRPMPRVPFHSWPRHTA